MMGTSCLGTFDIKESEVQPELSPHRPVKVGDNFRVLHTDKVLPIRGTSVHLSAGLANWKTWQQFDVRVLMNAGQFGNVSSFNWSHVQEKNPYSLTSTKQRFLETQCGACTLVSLVRYCSRRCFGNWCLNWCVRERVRDDTFIHSSYIIDS